MAKYLTNQRRTLLQYLSLHADEQLTAQQIADALKAENISVSAIYRNLSAMEKDGTLKRSTRDGAHEIFYQYIASDKCKNSLHLFCRVCGKSIHLGNEAAERLIGDALKSTGFQIDKSSTVLNGICENCRK